MLTERYRLAEVSCPAAYLVRLRRAIEQVDAVLPFDGHLILRLHVDFYAGADGANQGALILLNKEHVGPSLLAHEYAHFLDYVLSLRGEWYTAVKDTPEHHGWSMLDGPWSHPGEMFARYVEQLVCPERVFDGMYTRETHAALLPTFRRMVTP